MENTQESIQAAKQAAATAAAQLIENGMTVGLGTGSTAALFIDALISRSQQGLSIRCVSTSNASATQAAAGGIEVLDFDDVSQIDITVDGADEIDPNRRMIKGGGGALLREKIVASASDEMVVIVDDLKVVERLGDFGLPLEVIPFGRNHTIQALNDLGLQPNLRMTPEGMPFTTDNGNNTVDLSFSNGIADPEGLHAALLQVPGVAETGLFIDIAGRVVVGSSDGSHTLWPKP